MILSQEQMLKAMQCATVQELVSFAKEQDLNLTHEEAEAYLAEFSDLELTEQELQSINGFTEACRDCHSNRLCTGDGTCGGGRYRHTFQELDEAVA